MEILGIGMPELVFIVIIALLILGPKDMEKAGRTVGRFLRNIVTSDGWKIFLQTSRDLKNLPNRLIREANDELDKVGDEIKRAASPPDANRISPSKEPSQSKPYPATPAPGPDLETEGKTTPQTGHEPESEPKINA
jgi:Sec-independent protein translocase protein TatA